LRRAVALRKRLVGRGATWIDTLIIDRNEEVGDNWRNRYHALALHNEVYGNHLPYMPFPRRSRASILI
jgi:putative flavoprotein involved in K+ transport